MLFGVLEKLTVTLQAESYHGAFFLGADGFDAAVKIVGNLGDRHTAGK